MSYRFSLAVRPCFNMQFRQIIVIVGVQLALFSKVICQSTEPFDNQLLSNPESVGASLDSCGFENSEENLSLKTPGCVIPSLDLMDPIIRNMVYYPEYVGKCRNHAYPLLGSNQTHVWTIKENLRHYNKGNQTELKCCYSAIIIFPTSGGPVPTYQSCIPFKETIIVAEEFARVTCNVSLVSSYEEFFMFAPKKYFTPLRKYPFLVPESQDYNVLILGLSSLSRLNFRRTMPNTFKFLNSIGGIEMMGYSMISEKSISNILALLLGLDEVELRKTCWPTILNSVDRCPFIWERFKDSGYYTAFLEDSSKYSIFNVYPMAHHALSTVPTDYYLYPFIKEAEKVDTTCLRNQFYFQAVLDYLDNLITTLKTQKLFSIFWESSLTPLNLNNAMLMDHSYERFLIKLHKSGYLNNTILILLSEHGQKKGAIQETAHGRLEERLPLLYVLPPPSFSGNYSRAYENLKKNSKRIVTPFDVHKTLINLDTFNVVESHVVDLINQSDDFHRRSISLFLEVPCNRTCSSAYIDRHLCTCQESRPVPTDIRLVVIASKFLIQHINEMVSPYSQCAAFKLDSVVDATDLFLWYEFAEEWRDLALTVRAKPGGGEFKATVRYYFDKDDWSVVSSVKRINTYSEQSHCVNNLKLKMYCYCQNSQNSSK